MHIHSTQCKEGDGGDVMEEIEKDYDVMAILVKGHLCCKIITSQNVSSEAQI